MRENESEDVRPYGGIPLDVVQRYINYWFSVSLDLFGNEDSSNAAAYFAHGLKGRFNEANRKLYPDASGHEGVYRYLGVDEEEKRLREIEIPMRRAMNAVLRDAYIEDCERAVARWNKILEQEECRHRIKLPSVRFHRLVGTYARGHFDPHGNALSGDEFEFRRGEFLPTRVDRDYVKSVQFLVTEPGKFANWISPPQHGIHGKPLDFEYVRL
jgi:benzoyl-CoA 2,3-dioxygenase component B